MMRPNGLLNTAHKRSVCVLSVCSSLLLGLWGCITGYFFPLPLGVKRLREQRFPPKHVTVMKPTRISVGRVATLKAGRLLVLLTCILVWEIQQEKNMHHLGPAMLSQSECDHTYTL